MPLIGAHSGALKVRTMLKLGHWDTAKFSQGHQKKGTTLGSHIFGENLPKNHTSKNIFDRFFDL